MNWAWFHRWGSTPWFVRNVSPWVPWLLAAAAVMLLVGAFWGLMIAPPEAKQGNSARIIYIHVPAAFIALAGYYTMAISGAIGLIWRMKIAFWVMRAVAPIGAAMTFVALITGALWGKPTWGTYWVWDARMTSMTILLFLYLGVIALIHAYRDVDNGYRASAILGLVGTINIPIIYKSVDWWYTLHQPATLKLTEDSPIHPDILYPLLFMIAAFYLLFAAVTLANTCRLIIGAELNKRWVKEWFEGKQA